MSPIVPRAVRGLVLAVVVAGLPVAPAPAAEPATQAPTMQAPTAQDPTTEGAGPAEAIDYLTFANGAIPLSVGGDGAALGADMEAAVRFIDGRPGAATFLHGATAETDTEFVYELPALTTFTRFGVPEIHETPSPSQTFVRRVEIFGSDRGIDGPYELLAAAELETHSGGGEETAIPIGATLPVRWVKLRLVGGIHILTEKSFLEFGEIIGNGTQEPAPPIDRFRGVWKGRGVLMELEQDASVVAGCFDSEADLEGTVSGNILSARGVDPRTGVVSLFILNVAEDETLRGVRSTNGGPFRVYTAPPAPDGTETHCGKIPEPALGCESIVHGIRFDFDSAAIRPDSEPILAALFEGLDADVAAHIVIEGHTSSEGSNAYNLELSERRAQTVVDDLVRRGIDAQRIQARGFGETVPIAENDSESGRSLNRRVEVRCTDS